MPDATFPETLPRLERRNGEWDLEWDRSRETGIILNHLHSGNFDKSRICTVYNADDLAFKNISIASREMVGSASVVNGGLWAEQDYIWVWIAGAFMRSRQLILPAVTTESLKYTANSNIHYALAHAPTRSMSNFVHRQRRAGNPVAVRTAMERELLKPAYQSDEMDIIVDQSFTSRKRPVSDLVGVVQQDWQLSNEFRKFVESQIFLFQLRYNILSGYKLQSQAELFPGIKIAAFSAYFNSYPGVRSSKYSEILSGALSDITFEDGKELLRPVWERPGDTAEIEKIADGILRGAAKSPLLPSTRLSEYGLQRALGALQEAAGSLPQPEAMEDQLAPMNAVVVHDRLQIVEALPITNTPLEQIEALREAYLSDVARLSEMLAGSNAGPGFNARLEAVAQYLSEEFTHSRSLILATQVRALEDMFPSVKDMLSDITAADVGATVAGLGMYIRQFPAWIRFAKEAEEDQGGEIDITDVALVSEIIESQESGTVSSELVEGLSAMREAAAQSTDNVVRIGFIRSVGNIFRAIGRYVRERAISIRGEFEKSFDENIGQFLASSFIAGIVMTSSEILSKLVTTFPSEYGWLAGLLVFIALQIKR